MSQQHVLNTQNLFPIPLIQPINSQPNKRITRSHPACHNHPATQTLAQTTTSSKPQDNSTNPFTQQVNNINSIYHIHNNPTFQNTDFTEPHAQHRPRRKRRCKLLGQHHDVTLCLSLPRLRTTHIQQEIWTYKKDKAFSMTL